MTNASNSYRALTAEEIEIMREELLRDLGWLEGGKDRLRTICDMAIRSLAGPCVPFEGQGEEWIRGQVAFYDFIFQAALQMCAQHTKESMIQGFSEGKDPYEDAIKAIAGKWATFADALADYRRDATAGGQK